VVWECDDCIASESDVTGKLEGKFFVKRTYLARPTVPIDNPDHAKLLFLHQWAEIVRFYSQGKLSVETDKLIAISGVAKYMQSMLRSDEPLQYYAGHWSHDFERQLTWSASPFCVGNRQPTYIAPSWSWASYNGGVIFPYPHRRQTLWANLISMDIHHESDSFGAVSSGFIRMRGPLCRAVTAYATNHMHEEGPKTLRLLGSGVEIECVDLIFDESNEMDIIEDGAEQQNHLVMFGIVQSEDTDDRPFEGTILRLTGLQRGQYKRIGAFRVDDLLPRSLEEEQKQRQLCTIFGGDPEELERDNFGPLKDAFDAMDMPEVFFESRGDDWYQFTII
jgi:hypothetical protein